METVMQSHICLFVGLSGDDERLDALMVETHEKQKHAYNRSETGFWGIAFSTSHDPNVAKTWKARGVFLHKLDGYDKDLPKFLFEICQRAASP